MKCLAAAISLLLAIPVAAATREELKRQRDAIEAEYAQRADACKKQFIVTACLDRARIDKQKALSDVAAQEVALEATKRQSRAEARQKRVADKAGGQASSAAAQPLNPASAASPRQSRRTPKVRPQPHLDRSLQEQEKRNAFEARQREIEAHRQRVEQRNTERALKKPAPRPLPPPASGGGS